MKVARTIFWILWVGYMAVVLILIVDSNFFAKLWQKIKSINIAMLRALQRFFSSFRKRYNYEPL